MKTRLPWFTLTLVATSTFLHFQPDATALLEFNRNAATGEVWRWFTAHLVHFNTSHFAWDAVALLILGTWTELVSRRGLMMVLLVSTVAISGAVWLWQPDLATYRGLSGVDSALFGWVVMHLRATARREHDRPLGVVAALAGALFFAKAAYELAVGQTLFATSSGSFAPVPLAHCVGLICGAAIQVAFSRRSHSARNPHPEEAAFQQEQYIRPQPWKVGRGVLAEPRLPETGRPTRYGVTAMVQSTPP